MLNLAMAFGQDIAQSAIQIGATASNASNAIWVLAVAWGAVANIGYCVLLLVRNGTVSAFGTPRSAGHWLMGALMGALLVCGVTVYGSGPLLSASGVRFLGGPF